jgi:hypothetical protein
MMINNILNQGVKVGLGSLEEHLVSSCFQVLMSMISLFDAFLINLFDGLPDSASREL